MSAWCYRAPGEGRTPAISSARYAAFQQGSRCRLCDQLSRRGTPDLHSLAPSHFNVLSVVQWAFAACHACHTSRPPATPTHHPCHHRAYFDHKMVSMSSCPLALLHNARSRAKLQLKASGEFRIYLRTHGTHGQTLVLPAVSHRSFGMNRSRPVRNSSKYAACPGRGGRYQPELNRPGGTTNSNPNPHPAKPPAPPDVPCSTPPKTLCFLPGWCQTTAFSELYEHVITESSQGPS